MPVVSKPKKSSRQSDKSSDAKPKKAKAQAPVSGATPAGIIDTGGSPINPSAVMSMIARADTGSLLTVIRLAIDESMKRNIPATGPIRKQFDKWCDEQSHADPAPEELCDEDLTPEEIVQRAFDTQSHLYGFVGSRGLVDPFVYNGYLVIPTLLDRNAGGANPKFHDCQHSIILNPGEKAPHWAFDQNCETLLASDLRFFPGGNMAGVVVHSLIEGAYISRSKRQNRGMGCGNATETQCWVVTDGDLKRASERPLQAPRGRHSAD